MGKETLEDLIVAFIEGEEKLAWAKLIKNKFRQNSQVRKSERHLQFHPRGGSPQDELSTLGVSA